MRDADDEGWWATGGHLFTVLLTCVAVLAVVEALLSWSYFRSFLLPVGASVVLGVPAGERLWRRMRRTNPRIRRRSRAPGQSLARLVERLRLSGNVGVRRLPWLYGWLYGEPSDDKRGRFDPLARSCRITALTGGLKAIRDGVP
jgi:hypothetical protein